MNPSCRGGWSCTTLAGLMPGCLSWLADNPDAIVSVHYLVTRDGKVYQIGRDTWAMWHAGRTLWSD